MPEGQNSPESSKSPLRLAGGGGSNPQRPPATTWQQKCRTRPSSAAIQLGKMEPTQQSLPQQQRESAGVHSRRSSITRSRDFWLARQCIQITSFSIYAHTTLYAYIQFGYAYTHTLQFTPYAYTPYAYTPYAYTPYTYTPYAYTPYAYTPFYMYLDLSVPPESLTVLSCAMRPAACWQLLLLNDSVFLSFVPWS